LGFGVWGLRLRVSSFGGRVSGFRFRVEVLGFEVWGFGCRVSGFGFRALNLVVERGLGGRDDGCLMSCLGLRVEGLGFEFRVQGLGFRKEGLGCRVSGFGFRVSGVMCRL